jgi:phage FluMu protein Com
MVEKSNELIDIRCEKGQLLARVDSKALQGVLEFKCKRCGKVHIFKDGKELKR